MKTNYEQGAAAFALNNRVPQASGIPPVALLAMGLCDRFGEEIVNTLDAVISPRLCHSGGEPATATADGTNLDIVTTETYISEVFLPANATITGIAVFNGTAVAGNLTVFLCNSLGVVLASSASTAASGTTAYQRIPLSVAYSAKGPGTYYIAVQGNNAGGDLRTHTVGNFGASKATGGTYGTLVSITPPTTFTTAVGILASLY